MSSNAAHDNPSPWQTNTTLKEISDWLLNQRSVMILTHTKPDGDAVGSTLGLCRALRAKNIDARCWYAGPMPTWITGAAGDTPYELVEKNWPPADEPDAIVILDTGSWSQLSDVEPWLRKHKHKATVIDHHLQGHGDVADRMLVDSSAAAVCVTIAELATLILGLDSPAELPENVAQACFMGIATDTGWFRHSNTKPRTLRLAADLLEAGADQPTIYQLVEQRDRPSRYKLMARALASLELHHDGKLAIITQHTYDFAECDAAPGDSGGFADLALSIASVKVSVVLTEAATEPTPLTKLSLRSKAGPDGVNVNQLAQKFGGGGHAQAAGARVNKPINKVKARLIELLP